MSKNNRICKVCGQGYYFCPTCGTHKPSWYKLFNSENCRDAYMAISDYAVGNIDANKANEILSKTNVIFVDEEIKAIAEEIKRNSKKSVKKTEFDEM